MNPRPCPSCKQTLPEATLRALPHGTTCPFCAAPLKWTPRRPAAGQPVARAGDLAKANASATPPPAAVIKTPPPPAASKTAPAAASKTAPAAASKTAPAAVIKTPPPVASKTAPAAVLKTPPPVASTAPPPAANTPPPVIKTPLPVAMAPAAPPAMPPPAPPMMATSPLVSPGPSRTRKLVLMGCGAAVPLVIALVVGLRSPGGAKANASVVTTAPPAAGETIQLAAVSPEIAPREANPPAAAPADAADTEPAPRRHAVRAKRKSSVAHHGKRQPRHEARPVTKSARQQRTVVAKAAKPAPAAPAERGDPRSDYERGNALLFAGDAAGAITAYREAVHEAPGDPIGYRGLGLAYEQKGDTSSAIRALRKYLKLAPNAADRAIISRRIERLSKHGGAK